jgi:aminomethyltransferase
MRRHHRRPDGDAPARQDDDGRLFLVVNASRKEVDYAHIASRLPPA